MFSTTDNTGNEPHQCSRCVRYNKKSDVRWFHCSNVTQPLMYQHLKAVVSTDDTRLCVCQACHSWARRQLKRSELDSPLLDKRKTGRKVCIIDSCFQPVQGSTEIDDNGMPIGLCSKHYCTSYRQENETTCFYVANDQTKKFHKPINPQLFQRGVVTDIDYAT